MNTKYELKTEKLYIYITPARHFAGSFYSATDIVGAISTSDRIVIVERKVYFVSAKHLQTRAVARVAQITILFRSSVYAVWNYTLHV